MGRGYYNYSSLILNLSQPRKPKSGLGPSIDHQIRRKLTQAGCASSLSIRIIVDDRCKAPLVVHGKLQLRNTIKIIILYFAASIMSVFILFTFYGYAHYIISGKKSIESGEIPRFNPWILALLSLIGVMTGVFVCRFKNKRIFK
jgi:hypothetical protein